MPAVSHASISTFVMFRFLNFGPLDLMSVNVALDGFTFVNVASWRFTSVKVEFERLACAASTISFVFWIFMSVTTLQTPAAMSAGRVVVGTEEVQRDVRFG